jgi:hypothetical protein
VLKNSGRPPSPCRRELEGEGAGAGWAAATALEGARRVGERRWREIEGVGGATGAGSREAVRRRWSWKQGSAMREECGGVREQGGHEG